MTRLVAMLFLMLSALAHAGDIAVIASAAYFRQKLAEFDANLGQGAETRAGVQSGP
jgi:hypothetical protein